MMDVSAISYSELKRIALENIMRLEMEYGRISRHNSYQDLLNAIALDIRTKSRRRVQRQRELETVKATLDNLHEKAIWLEQQRKSYDNYIEQAMMTLQNKKGYVTIPSPPTLDPPNNLFLAKNASSSPSPANITTSANCNAPAANPNSGLINTQPATFGTKACSSPGPAIPRNNTRNSTSRSRATKSASSSSRVAWAVSRFRGRVRRCRSRIV
jgi:hypothetical protein